MHEHRNGPTDEAIIDSLIRLQQNVYTKIQFERLHNGEKSAGYLHAKEEYTVLCYLKGEAIERKASRND